MHPRMQREGPAGATATVGGSEAAGRERKTSLQAGARSTGAGARSTEAGARSTEAGAAQEPGETMSHRVTMIHGGKITL